MDKALLAMLFILFVFLIMAPIIVWINNRTNDNPEEMDDLSEGNLVKLEIKKNLLNMLDQWIQENDLNHDQIAIKLAVNLNVVADIVHQRFDKFTVDRLIYLVLRTGQQVKLVITDKDK
ncbi:MAG TPA: XRE family transcriptional regulator [Methylotenera sp.]